MHHRKMPGRASLHRRQHHAIDRLMPFTGAPLFHALQLLATGGFRRASICPATRDSRCSTRSADDFRHRLHRDLRHGQPVPRRRADPRRRGRGGALFRRGRLLFPDRRLDAGRPRHACGRGGRPRRQRAAWTARCHTLGLPRLRAAGHHAAFLSPRRLLEPFAVYGRAARGGRPSGQLLAHPDIRAGAAHLAHLLRRCGATYPAFADLCRAHGRLLLVDAAHGAHFPAVGLPVAGRGGRGHGGALHAQDACPVWGRGRCCSGRTRARTRASLRENTALFGTSSPSYPIMASIDLARAYTEGPGPRAAYQPRGGRLRRPARITSRAAPGFHTRWPRADFPALDPCRLTVCTAGTDITGRRSGRRAVERARRGL